MTNYYFILFYFSLFILFLKMTHLLSFLIIFEVLSLFLVFYLMGGFVYMDISYVFFSIFTLSVCESIIGLILFVSFTRYFSKDYLFSFSILSL